MELTVGYLRKVMKDLDDDIILAHLGECSNSSFEPFMGVKRLILVKDKGEKNGWEGRRFLVINSMGTHFTGKGAQKSVEPIAYFDNRTFDKTDKE